MISWREHLPWAIRLARRFRPVGLLTVDDYEVIASTAVWRAAQKYDNRAGVQFQTYARHYVEGDILHAMRDSSGVPGCAYALGERFEAFQFSDIDEDKSEDIVDLSPSVTDTVLEADAAARLWTAVDGLGGRQSEVIRRHYGDDETYQAIAGSWGASLQAAWHHRRTALDTLARCQSWRGGEI